MKKLNLFIYIAVAGLIGAHGYYNGFDSSKILIEEISGFLGTFSVLFAGSKIKNKIDETLKNLNER